MIDLDTISNSIETERVPCCVCGNDCDQTVGQGVDFEYETSADQWQFVRCTSCGHHFLNPRPTAAELSRIYPKNYGNYTNSVDPGLAFRTKAWLEQFTLRRLIRRVPAGGVVLDVGCGDGRLLDGIRRAATQPLRLEGIEISEVAARVARQKGYAVQIGGFDDLDLPAESYDLICLVQVLEHVFEPVECLRKIHRLLRPGGLALIETPSVKCADFALFKRRFWGGYHFPRHLNLFEPHSLSQVAEQCYLNVESVRHKLQPVHWVWSCHHWFKERGWPAWWTNSFNIRNPLWLGFFTLVDAVQLLALGRSSNMQLILRKI
jgi:SAM-dependent methyltransferase